MITQKKFDEILDALTSMGVAHDKAYEDLRWFAHLSGRGPWEKYIASMHEELGILLREDLVYWLRDSAKIDPKNVLAVCLDQLRREAITDGQENGFFAVCRDFLAYDLVLRMNDSDFLVEDVEGWGRHFTMPDEKSLLELAMDLLGVELPTANAESILLGK